jgi:outer membrane protein OmpA-like peptidoglycan-associated protein
MAQSVDRLKELLFDSESRELSEMRRQIASASEQGSLRDAELAQRIDRLFERAGSEERFRDSVAQVIDGALRDAEVKKHDQMARAVAPLVVRTIKTELKNSQDEMVEALYPIMGRLVKAYVVSAVKDMTDQINRRIEGNAVMLRLRSLASGRSVAELAIADGQRLEVEELFLVRRGSGELVQRWPEGQGSTERDIHLSGVLTAINEFAAHTFQGEGGNLRSFELDTFTVYLRASPAYLLAAKCRGSAPPGIESVLDDEFLETIQRNKAALSAGGAASSSGSGAVPERVLAPLAASLQARLAERQAELTSPARTITPVRLLLAMVLLPLIGWLGWRLYSDYVTSQARETAQRVIDGTPELLGYPTTLDVQANGRVITVGGLAPSASVKADVITRLRQQFSDGSVVDRINVVAGAFNEAMPQIARVRRDLAGLETELARSTVRRQLDRSTRRLGEVGADLGRLETAITDPAQRAVAHDARGVAAEVMREIAEIGRSLAVSDASPGSLAALSGPLDGLAARVRRSAAALGALLSKAPPPAAAAESASADVIDSAERLSVATERLQAIAAAAAQAAEIKPAPLPPPPPPPPPQPTARERLDAWTRANAIFFSNGADYRSASASSAKLDALAGLIREARAPVRVIGFTDETGAATRNAPLAIARAEKVAADLVDRGIARGRLIIVGRSAGPDLTPAVGPTSANRRVEFQIAFEGETDETP